MNDNLDVKTFIENFIDKIPLKPYLEKAIQPMINEFKKVYDYSKVTDKIICPSCYNDYCYEIGYGLYECFECQGTFKLKI